MANASQWAAGVWEGTVIGSDKYEGKMASVFSEAGRGPMVALCGGGLQSARHCRLIAAAPEMLEALKLLHREFDSAALKGTRSKPTMEQLNRVWDAARAAIAKATGEAR